MTLNELRKKIDEIDLNIKELFLKRMYIAEEIASIKFHTGDKILKPEREEELIEKLSCDIEEDFKPAYSSLLKKQMEVSRCRQYQKMLKLGVDYRLAYNEETLMAKSVCFQGIPGSYSEMAVRDIFPDIDAYPVDSFDDVFQSINSGKHQAGVVPMENTTAGGVYEVYDLLRQYDLFINYIDIVKVDHCLAGIKGACLGDIKEVCSHPQAIAQSAEYLKKHGIKAIAGSNTAIAAKDVALRNQKSRGTICSRDAAERYGLNILMEGINHKKDNATRFAAVSKQLIVQENHDKIAVVFACQNRSGSLAGVLGIFADYGVNLTGIHARPDGKNPWEYIFYVDLTGNLKEERIRALFYQLTEELPFVKIIGSYHS
ncbi:MAG: prephenate dehydratase domain-containing protein [Eubacteriales bacterium]|nr:prephenate dehydratase domain-containing protein [Eubacteriales bacterium]MDD3198964.1 prephenate dehydratase domain-containing protein [Eubacteriales bacterium]MDD4122220.1 prephenate dehydratase domain-containing protein [Eubacteriales bacterium]MDD4629550.1 prephenate dehydratase domain-containing protein [Eubacteriales bacterium]